jgi:CarD family transcriptional regulator
MLNDRYTDIQGFCVKNIPAYFNEYIGRDSILVFWRGSMFVIGDRIVYPMHGAGVIEAVEERRILGETRRYYILNIAFGDMKIMIPCDSSELIGVREVITADQIMDVMEVLSMDSTEMSDNWNRRYRENMAKLKTGEPGHVAEVVRNLMRIDRVKKLSTGEKKMLANAKQILISELILAVNEEAAELESRIENAVCGPRAAAMGFA